MYIVRKLCDLFFIFYTTQFDETRSERGEKNKHETSLYWSNYSFGENPAMQPQVWEPIYFYLHTSNQQSISEIETNCVWTNLKVIVAY